MSAIADTFYAYHETEYCSGLNRFTQGVLNVSLADAEKKYGRVPCKKCYRGLK